MKRSMFWNNLEDSAKDIKRRFNREILPDTAVILGSGFKTILESLDVLDSIAFEEIANFRVPSIEGHGAEVLLASFNGKEVVVLTGRTHMYEGLSAEEVVYPIRALGSLGVQNLLVTNAAGSLTDAILPGTFVVLKDHLNFTSQNCLIGDAKEYNQSLFVDMANIYDSDWRARILEIEGSVEGIYAGVLGPNYETSAEARWLRSSGADVVGMSTVQEVIAAKHLKMKIAAISLVTNMSGGDFSGISHQEVLELGTNSESKILEIISQAILSV